MQTVAALFREFDHAQRAVDDLMRRGFDRNKISLVSSNATGDQDSYIQTRGDQLVHADPDDAVNPAQGAAFGAASGGVIGALFTLGALTIPGIGPVIAAGPLIAALTGGAIGAAAGAPTGGILAGLIHSNYVNESDAHVYAEGVRRGQTLLTLQTDESKVVEATSVIHKYDPTDVSSEEQSWRSSGWDKFDADAAPLPADELIRYRTVPKSSVTATPATGADDTQKNRVRVYSQPK